MAGISSWELAVPYELRIHTVDEYALAMAGMTYFERTDEYFKLTHDTRVCTIGFTYRFGKTYKTAKRSSGGASDEMERVGTGN